MKRFIDILSDFYEFWDSECEELLEPRDKLVVEVFAEWLDDYTLSEFKPKRTA